MCWSIAVIAALTGASDRFGMVTNGLAVITSLVPPSVGRQVNDNRSRSRPLNQSHAGIHIVLGRASAGFTLALV